MLGNYQLLQSCERVGLFRELLWFGGWWSFLCERRRGADEIRELNQVQVMKSPLSHMKEYGFTRRTRVLRAGFFIWKD